MSQIVRLLQLSMTSVFILTLLTGCRAQQLQTDQDRFRCALLQMETTQIMDNLVRAYNGLPIMHMDYSAITGTVTQNPSGQISGGSQLAGGPFTSTIAYMVGASQTNQLTVTANPVVDKPDVYAAYLDFIGKPDRLIASPTEPPAGAAHMVQCFNGMYYWVPLEYRIDFLEMALKTSVMRGAPAAPPQSLDVKIDKVDRIEGDLPELPGDLKINSQFTVYAELTDEIKNDRGTILISIDGASVLLTRDLVDEVGSGQMTNKIRFRYHFGPDLAARQVLKTPDEFKAYLANKTASIFPARFKPEVPTTETQLNAIRHELGLIRLNGTPR